MNNVATFFLTENDKRVSIFKVVSITLLVVIAMAGFGYLLFEKQIVLYLINHLPQEPGKTQAYYADLVALVAREFLWIGIIVFIAWILFSNPFLLVKVDQVESKLLRRSSFSRNWMIALSSFLVLVCAYFVLQEFPNSADEYVYLLQAETLSDGKLWHAAHPITKSFPFNHIAVKDGIALGRFPPGWPLILSVAYVIGFPASLVNPMLAFVSLLVFYKLARKLYGTRVALWSLMLLGFTGFFVFNSASFFSHTVCMLECLLFVYCIYLFIESHKVRYGILAGFFLGLIVITRYYTAFLLFLPFFISLLYFHRMRAIMLFIWMGIGALPCLAFFFWYNYTITGNPITPVTVWAYQQEGLGFIKGHTVVKGLEHILRRIVMFFYWCSPVLLGLYLFFIWDKIKDKRSRLVSPEDYLFFMLLIGYFFYYEIGGNQYGPRFYYEALPFLILFVVSKIFRQKRNWAKVLCYAALVVAVLKLPFIAWHEHEVIEERQDLYTQVKQEKINHAVVLVSTFTGVKRPMPIGDLTRNDRQYQNDVIYAYDNQEFNAALMEYYKGRKFYRYVREAENPHGKLIPLQ